MPFHQKHPSPLWGIWKIEESPDELLALLDRPAVYLPTVSRYKTDSRKAEWLAVRVLLKSLTGSELNIAYRDNGSPYLPESHLHISISHTKGYAAVLLSPDKPVGIDIEYRSDRIHRIKSRFLSEAELLLLEENPDTDKLLICWSAKETVFKMLEHSAVDWQKDIQVIEIKPTAQDHGIIMVKEMLTPQSTIYQIAYSITPNFIITHSQ